MNPDYLADREARNELEPGEQLKWVGAPEPTRMMIQSLPILVFAIPWTAFALFWMAMALSSVSRSPIHSGVSMIFPLFGLPFVLIGLCMLSAPVWARRKARRTVYAVTDRRAMIILTGRTRSVRSFGRTSMTERECRERADRSGDLIFYRKISSDGEGGTNSTPVGFFAIPDVRSVERLVINLESNGGPTEAFLGPADRVS